jgi:hypothetical protein
VAALVEFHDGSEPPAEYEPALQALLAPCDGFSQTLRPPMRTS